jgi:hypothetical protein
MRFGRRYLGTCSAIRKIGRTCTPTIAVSTRILAHMLIAESAATLHRAIRSAREGACCGPPSRRCSFLPGRILPVIRNTSSELNPVLAASLQGSWHQSVCEDRLLTRRSRGEGNAVVFMVGGYNRETLSGVGGRYSCPRVFYG